ncbi:TRAP transporter small permease [Anaerobacillus sp. MEB173]|uniref:TRAP transporter small permease n=1 Tax=Anaerobacillus sp. MEB173 TaxID=3383345 RepID=UPI003F8F77DA
MWTKGIKFINRIVENISALFLATMVILIFIQVISRQFIGSSFAWTEEVSRYLMIWVTFLGASVAFQYGAHIGIEYFKEKSPVFIQRAFEILTLIACTVFFYFMITKGIDIMNRQMGQTSAALKIPMGYIYLVIPISGVLMFLNLLDITFNKNKQQAKM